MSRTKPILIGGAAAAIIVGAAATLFAPLSKTDSITRTDAAEFAQAQTAFATLLKQRRSDLAGLESFNLRGGSVPGAADTLLLSQQSDACTGQGVYWIRPDASHSLAITAPHRGSDRHTGVLASALFLETGAQAAAWNSAPRFPTKNCDNAIDLAQEKEHLFSAFALGFAERSPDGLLVQLHGFDAEKRQSVAAREAGMILSNGTRQPSSRLLDLADCLSIAFAPTPVLVFPGDTDELGALGNAQGQLLHQTGFQGFVHIEMSADMRADLKEKPSLRAQLAACLAENAG